MLDFLSALGHLFVGLLYGPMLSVVNYKYSGSVRCRYDPMTGHDWNRDVPQHALRLMIVPTAAIVPAHNAYLAVIGETGQFQLDVNASVKEAV